MDIDNLQKIACDIDKEVFCYIQQTDGMPYEKRLKGAYNVLITALSSAQDNFEDFNSLKLKLNKYCKNIVESVELYQRGLLQSSLKITDKLLVINGSYKKYVTATYYSSVYELKEGTPLYRLRRNEKESFAKKDLFHVPIEKRGIVSTMRFSIPGFPCLYMGASPYCCWKELNMPDSFTAAKITVKEDVSLLDMRFGVKYKTLKQMIGYFVFYPFRIACSIPVNSNHSNDNFKPEYIIPQILLHTSIVGKASHRFCGIITTSTKYFETPNIFKDIRDADNIIVPMQNKGYNENGHCIDLADWFFIESIYDSRNEEKGYNRSVNKEYWKDLMEKNNNVENIENN